MNSTLLQALKLYATGSDEKFLQFLGGLSKPTLISLFSDLLTLYMNDKNSSKLRELVTAIISGYEFTTEKLGYNGYRQETYGKVFCEIKPQNIDDCSKKKLNGGGTFNDYTPERFDKDLKERLNVVVSGFIAGRLVYVLEFPFKCLENRLGEQLRKKFGEDLKRKAGDYLRSASFSFKHYKDCPELKKIYVSDKLDEFRKCLTRDLYDFLKGRSE